MHSRMVSTSQWLEPARGRPLVTSQTAAHGPSGRAAIHAIWSRCHASDMCVRVVYLAATVASREYWFIRCATGDCPRRFVYFFTRAHGCVVDVRPPHIPLLHSFLVLRLLFHFSFPLFGKREHTIRSFYSYLFLPTRIMNEYTVAAY